MKIERKYEDEHGWKKEWDIYGWFICNSPVPDKKEEIAYARYEEFKAFEKKWSVLKTKMRVPGWYHFDPELPEERPSGHNKMKEWDQNMFNFLKKQKWMEQTNKKDEKGRYLYEETSSFVVNCEDLLGIGGEGIVIRKSVTEKRILDMTPEGQNDRKFEALKIIPIEDLNHTREFRHNNLMEYSNKKLDFIKVFGQTILVMVICKFYFFILMPFE